MSNLPLSPPLELDGSRAPTACVPCAHAKVKCELETRDGICKRCLRLKKACRPQAPGAHRRKPGGRTSNVARLEQKLDGVAAILAASERVGIPRDLAKQASLFNSTVASSPEEVIEEFAKNDSETALMLDVFRTEMTPLFPFVVTSPALSVRDLKERRPFLLLVALTVACRHDMPRQKAMAKRVREILSQKVLLKGEQSLDLLQGLLIFTAWYHVHLNLSRQLTNLAHLAMAMVVDLRLHVPGLTPNYPKPSKEYFRKDRQAATMKPRTLEERRTFLGCFYLTSVISMSARDLDPIKYTKYADESCRILAEAAEYPTDILVVQLSKLHCISEKISRTLAIDAWDTSTKVSAPIAFCVNALESELQQFKSAVPPIDPLQSGLLFFNYYTIQTILHETALDDNIDFTDSGAFPMTRYSMLFACLNSAKSSFEAFFSLPIYIDFDLPYTVWTLLGHMLVVVSRLTLFNADGWDQAYMRNNLDFFDILNKLARRLEDATAYVTSSADGGGSDSMSPLPRSVPELFASFAQKMQNARDVHEAKRAAQSRQDQAAVAAANCQMQSEGVVAPAYPDDLNLPGSTALFEFLDENFWSQFT